MSRNRTLLGVGFIATILAAVAILVAVATLAPRADAQRLLTDAAEDQTVVKTYSYSISSGQTRQTDDDPPVFTSNVTGHVVDEEGVYLKIRTTLGYVEYLVLPDNQYERPGPDDDWVKSSGSAPGFQLPKIDSSAHAGFIDNLDDVKVVSEETHRGVEVTKITAQVNMARKAQQIWGDIDEMSEEVQQGVDTPRKQMLAGEEEFVALIEKEDGLIYQYSTHGSYPVYGELKAYESWQTVTFSDFNEPFEIPSPPDSDNESDGDGGSDADPTSVPTPLPTPTPEPTSAPDENPKDSGPK